jgi:uncharacterized membrane protein (UPF0127 family)
MRRLEKLRILQTVCPDGARLSLALADGFAARLVGLAGMPRLRPGWGLLIPNCRSVHTLGMRFPLDVAFVAWSGRQRLRLVEVVAGVPPARLVSAGTSATGGLAALELGAGQLRERSIEVNSILPLALPLA